MKKISKKHCNKVDRERKLHTVADMWSSDGNVLSPSTNRFEFLIRDAAMRQTTH